MSKDKQFSLLVKRLKKKTAKTVNPLAEKSHLEAFTEIDCLDCANCCKSIPPIISRNDAKRISKHLGLTPKQFANNYLSIDNDGDTVFNQSPCVFLQNDNKCKIYEVRPTACRQYPHTDDGQFYNNLNLHLTNANYCPAVANILDKMNKAFS